MGRLPADPGVIDRMSSALHHRGPDDDGVWRSGDALLAHRRLAILDLSVAGHQPMCLGDSVLTYNGEIYNYRDLRRGLPGPFRSQTDSEVLLHAFRQHGASCLERLRGMFAFAIWDRRRKRLFAARDRLGIKPFYFRTMPGALAFASEVAPLLQLGSPEIDDSSLADYLGWGYVPTPKTPWRGIHKLEAASHLTWQDGELRIERYWRPDRGRREHAGDPAELDRLLSDSVSEHTLSDVPVGVFLSGGLDSSTIVSYLDRPSTFTLAQPQEERDEASAARRVAERFDTRHHEEMAEIPRLASAAEEMVRVFGEPFGDSAALSVWLVSRMTRRFVKVALSGEGGDEVFCGYRWYGSAMRRRSAWHHRLAGMLLPALSRGGRSLRRRAAHGLERYAAFVGIFSPWQVTPLLGERLAAAAEEDLLWPVRRHWRPDLELTRRIQWADLHGYLHDGMLTKVDRASMDHSLEVRPPLLDHRLVEWSFACEPESKWQPETDRGKALLRRLMADRLPPGHLERPKRGFNLAIRRWSASQPEVMREALQRLADHDIVRSERIVSLSHDQTWSLLVLDRWLDRFDPSYR